MRKNIFIAIGVLLLVIVVFYSAPKVRDNLGGQSLPSCYLGNNEATTTALGTLGTANFLSTTGTSSLTCFIARADKMDMNVWLEATTSQAEPTLLYNVFFSDNAVDWYPQDGLTNTSNNTVTHGTNVLTHYWATASTVDQKNFEIPTVASKYIKIDFGVVTADIDIFVEGVLRAITRNN